MTERRSADRLPMRLFVTQILDEGRRCLCVTEDLSAHGMRISRVRGAHWGQPRHAWLEFELPDDGPAIRALGELRHDATDDDAIRGFRFKYLNPHARRRFERFIASAAA